MTVYKYKRIAVKVGSNVLTLPDGTLDIDRISEIVDQVTTLHRSGVEVLLISSGAVASGRNIIDPTRKLDSVAQRQLFSSIGQVVLINHYYRLFHDKGLVCGQILTTKEDFSSRNLYLNQKNCMTVMLENGVIPVINENDTIAVSELMFTDNDELSGLVASMMDAEALIILSNIDGIYNGNPKDPKSQVIAEIQPKMDLKRFIADEKSSFGRGGMLTKCNIARKVADEGITVIIANGQKDSILPDLMNDAKNVICTRFIPTKKPSAVKKWIAHSDGFAKGEVHINEGLLLALNKKATSILPIGVNKIEGDFEKNDIVTIFDSNGNAIGVGKAQYGSITAKELLGKKGEKALIHYNYLYLD